MHARELIELAGLAASHGPVLIRDGGQISSGAIEQYWCASKCRLDRWSRSLKEYAGPPNSASTTPGRCETTRAVLEEILTGEILTRVWTGVLVAHDRHRATSEAEPVARSVWLGHLEARRRALALMVQGPPLATEQAVALNRLRRRTERWCDFLLGYLLASHDVREFAVVPERAQDFADDLKHQLRQAGGQHAWPLALASLRAAFQNALSDRSPNADVNVQIAASILGCFQAELFDSTGLFRSLWMVRLANAASDAQGMIDELLCNDDRPSVKSDRFGRPNHGG